MSVDVEPLSIHDYHFHSLVQNKSFVSLKSFFLFQTLCLLLVTMADKSVTESRRLPVSKEKIINLNLTEMKEVKKPYVNAGLNSVWKIPLSWISFTQIQCILYNIVTLLFALFNLFIRTILPVAPNTYNICNVALFFIVKFQGRMGTIKRMNKTKSNIAML